MAGPMSFFFCLHCKKWQDNLMHRCVFRFCACEKDKLCDFHKRGGYTTKDDDV